MADTESMVGDEGNTLGEIPTSQSPGDVTVNEKEEDDNGVKLPSMESQEANPEYPALAEQDPAIQNTAEQNSTEQNGPNNVTEQSAIEHHAAEQNVTEWEQIPTEQKLAEQASAEQKSIEQIPTEQKLAEQTSAEQNSIEQIPTEPNIPESNDKTELDDETVNQIMNMVACDETQPQTHGNVTFEQPSEYGEQPPTDIIPQEPSSLRQEDSGSRAGRFPPLKPGTASIPRIPSPSKEQKDEVERMELYRQNSILKYPAQMIRMSKATMSAR